MAADASKKPQQKQQSWFRRTLTKIEPSLQHSGFAITFIFAYFVINAFIVLRGAAKGWVLGKNDPHPWFDVLARSGGALLNLNSALVILVAAKSTMTYLRRTALNMIVPFDKAMPAFHMIIGNVLVLGTVLHVAFQTCNYVVFDLWNNNPAGRAGLTHTRSLLITGAILTLIIAAMRITSLGIVRRRKFEIFWATHVFGFVLYFIVLMLHGFHDKVAMTYRYTTGPVVIYVLDRIWRWRREKSNKLRVHRSSLQQKGDDMTCVRFQRPFKYLAGQYCELKVPSISSFEWHPFTIASSPHESEMLFFCKKNGDWTGKLHKLAGLEPGTGPEYLDIHVRGPYGAPAQHVGQYEHVVLISGGVGATPFASITKYVHHWIMNYTNRGMDTSGSVYTAFTHNRSAKNSAPNTPGSSRRVSRNISRSYSRTISHSGSRILNVPMSRSSSSSMLHQLDANPSFSSMDQIIKQQRLIQPHGPRPHAHDSSPPGPKGEPDGQNKPLDYVVELGNPDEPIPDRFVESDEVVLPSGRRMMEVVREYDSSRSLFSDDGEYDSRKRGRMSLADRMLDRDEVSFGEMDLEMGGMQLEDEILREQQTASNAYNMLGMSYGSAALLRHLQTAENGDIRSSQIRASMHCMEEAMDRATWRDRMLFYLHSVTLNWMLIWVMILRFTMLGVADITGRFILQGKPLNIYNSMPFAIVDLALGAIVLIPIVLAMVIEISTRGLWSYIVDDLGNVVDSVCLVPLLSASLALTGYLVFTDKQVNYMFEITVYFIWPLTALLLLWRAGRTIGSRISLAQNFKSTHSQTKSVDFLWVSRKAQDDQWLISELLPLAGSGIVRLHRFITREEPTTEPWMLDYEKVPLQTTYKRPDWDHVFSSLIERSRSGTVVGVFFCGPDGMARAIQQSAMKAMAKSVENAKNRGYVPKLAESSCASSDVEEGEGNETPFGGSKPAGPLTRALSKGGKIVRSMSSRIGGRQKPCSETLDKSEFGCNVRISVRVENFQ